MAQTILRASTICLLLVAVSTAQAQQRELPIVVIEHGDTGTQGGLHSTDRVIRDQAAWMALWDALHPGGEVPLPEVDFARRMVIFASMDTQPSVDARVSVRRIELQRIRFLPRRFSTVVHIDEERAGPGCLLLPSVSTPYVLVETDLSWDVTYRRKTRYIDCR